MLIVACLLALVAPGQGAEGGESKTGASLKDIARAERHYREARYEKAQKALKKGCDQGADPSGCERLNAFIHTALGDFDAARVAFDRLLLFDPDASLAPDVSPKLKGMFAEAKQVMRAIHAIRLEPLLRQPQTGNPSLLELKNPSHRTVTGVTVFLDAGAGTFEFLSLARQGDVWSGSWVPSEAMATETPSVRSPGEETGMARYYLAVDLAGAGRVWIGSENRPFTLEWPEVLVEPASDQELPLARPDELPLAEEGLSGWAPWLIAGGSVAVVGAVVGVVVGVVVAGQSPPTGTVEVNVSYYEE